MRAQRSCGNSVFPLQFPDRAAFGRLLCPSFPVPPAATSGCHSPHPVRSLPAHLLHVSFGSFAYIHSSSLFVVDNCVGRCRCTWSRVHHPSTGQNRPVTVNVLPSFSLVLSHSPCFSPNLSPVSVYLPCSFAVSLMSCNWNQAACSLCGQTSFS